MKKFKFIVVLTLGLFCVVMACVYSDRSIIQRNRIENTSLFWVSKQENQNGKMVKMYRLIAGDNVVLVDWIQDNFDNPFCNCRGLVFIGKRRGQMELFDCRFGKLVPVLSAEYLAKNGYVLDELRPRYDDDNLVVINLHKKSVAGFMGKRTLIYNLKSEKLSSFIN